jgi:hypothetical protein
MSAAGWICVTLLSWGQTDDSFPIASPIGESVAFASTELTNFQGPTAPFVLPNPSAPPPEPAVASETLDLPATRMTAIWLAPGGAHGFGMTDLDVNHTWLLGYDDLPALNITPGMGMHLWSGPLGLNLPARVYDLYVDFLWRPIDRQRSGVSFGMTPGLYGDFTRFDGHTLQFTGWGLGNYRFNSEWNALGGLAFVRQLRSHWLPIGGVVWTPNDDTRVEMLIPKPRLVRRCRSDEYGSAFWYLAGQLGGGAWAVADTPTNNVLVSYSDLRLLVGLETFHVRGREWNAEVGYVFSRHLAINGNAAQSPAGTALLQFSAAF